MAQTQRYTVVAESRARTGLQMVRWHLWDTTRPLRLGEGILSSSTDRDDLVVEARQRNAVQGQPIRTLPEPLDMLPLGGEQEPF